MAGKSGKGKPSQNGDVLAKLKGVYDFMTQNNLETVEIEESDLHLRMVRRRAQAPLQVPVPVVMTGAAPVAGPAGGSTPAPAASGNPLPQGQAIKAPMMGIFYRAPSPSSPPFVKEGDKVKPGQMICMIEAMKVFNEIKAEFPFTCVKVLLENGKPVKAGQDLFHIER